MNKRLIKMYYKKGIYKEKDLNTFVNARFITEDDKKEIMEVKNEHIGNNQYILGYIGV